MHFDHKSIFLSLQFYDCFRLLFCCQKASEQNGHSIMPSKTTVIQLHPRVYSNTVACTAQISTGIHNHECSTPLTERTNPPQVTTTWPESPAPKHSLLSAAYDVEKSHVIAWIAWIIVYPLAVSLFMSLLNNSLSSFTALFLYYKLATKGSRFGMWGTQTEKMCIWS